MNDVLVVAKLATLFAEKRERRRRNNNIIWMACDCNQHCEFPFSCQRKSARGPSPQRSGGRIKKLSDLTVTGTTFFER